MSPYLFPLASPCLPHSLSPPSRWSQSTKLICLCYAAASHQLSILRLVVYICPSHSLTLSHLALPPPRILKSILQQVSVFFFLINFIYLFIYLSLAELGLRCCTRAFSSCSKQGLLFIAVHGLLISVASLVVEHGLQMCGLQQLWHAGSVVVVHGLSCSAACGIFLDQGSNPCPLHWQADSQPLHHQGSPRSVSLLPSCPCVSCLCILDINPWSVASFADIFFQPIGCLPLC